MLKIKRLLLKPIEFIYPLLKRIYPAERVIKDTEVLRNVKNKR